MTELEKTYGDALYQLALEESLEQELLEQMNGVCALLRESPEYLRLIGSRALAKAERLALLDEAFGGKVHPYLLNFMKILCERGAFERIVGCRDAFVIAYNERHGIVPARVVSATPLSAQQEKRLIEALEKKTGKTILLEKRVDASLVGGMRVEMDGKRYDNTVASKMEHLRRALLAQS